MTLHLAIKEVLERAGHPLTPRQLANEVDRLGLYTHRDGTQPSLNQVRARVRRYPGLFVATSRGVWLADRTISTDTARPEPRAQQRLDFAPSNERPIDIETALLDPSHFRSARGVDDDVPDEFGLYAVRVRDVHALPEPYRSIAQERDSDLIYLGEATRRTLRVRFLGNELRGRGHGTFFRTIGVTRPGVSGDRIPWKDLSYGTSQ